MKQAQSSKAPLPSPPGDTGGPWDAHRAGRKAVYLGDLVGSSLSKGPERSRSPSNCAPHPLQTCAIIIPIPQGRKLRLSGASDLHRAMRRHNQVRQLQSSGSLSVCLMQTSPHGGSWVALRNISGPGRSLGWEKGVCLPMTYFPCGKGQVCLLTVGTVGLHAKYILWPHADSSQKKAVATTLALQVTGRLREGQAVGGGRAKPFLLNKKR